MVIFLENTLCLQKKFSIYKHFGQALFAQANCPFIAEHIANKRKAVCFLCSGCGNNATNISLFTFATARHRPKQPRGSALSTTHQRAASDCPSTRRHVPFAKQQNRKKDPAPTFRRLQRAARMFCRTFACAVTAAYGGLLSIANNAREVGLQSRRT